MKRILPGISLAVALALPAAAQDYQVGRFGVKVNLPIGLNERDLSWQVGPQPTNDDGRAFSLEGSAVTVAAWGNYMMEDSFADAVAARAGYVTDDGGEITYRAGKGDWAVLSGYRADRSVFYHRMERTADCDGGEVIVHVLIERGPDEGWFDALTGPIADSLAGCRD